MGKMVVMEPIDYQPENLSSTWDSQVWRRSRAGQWAAWTWLVGAYLGTGSAALWFLMTLGTVATPSDVIGVAIVALIGWWAPALVFGIGAWLHRKWFGTAGPWTMAAAGTAAAIYLCETIRNGEMLLRMIRLPNWMEDYASIVVPVAVVAILYSPMAVAALAARTLGLAQTWWAK
jgi:hypothetical protein